MCWCVGWATGAQAITLALLFLILGVVNFEQTVMVVVAKRRKTKLARLKSASSKSSKAKSS